MTDVLQSSLQLSRESSVMSDISSSSRTSLKIQKKIERATQKKLALEEEGPKYPDSKKRKCPFCGKLGHISKANKECDHHAEYVKQPAMSKSTIKASLKNTINLANGDMNTSFCESVQKFVRHCRDVTSVTSLFFNFVNMDCWNKISLFRLSVTPDCTIVLLLLWDWEPRPPTLSKTVTTDSSRLWVVIML